MLFNLHKPLHFSMCTTEMVQSTPHEVACWTVQCYCVECVCHRSLHSAHSHHVGPRMELNLWDWDSSLTIQVHLLSFLGFGVCTWTWHFLLWATSGFLQLRSSETDYLALKYLKYGEDGNDEKDVGWEITQGLAKGEFSTPLRTQGEKNSLVVHACNSCTGMPETGPCGLLAC